MTTVSAKLRERMGDFCATALEKVLNYPIGADLILSVKDRGTHRPAELTTARHRTFPLLVIHDRQLMAFAQVCEHNGWRVKLETKIPIGGGDPYVCNISIV